MSKIDTQGMSGPVDPTYRGKDNVYPRDADGNIIYPPANFKVWPIFDDKERAELKEIMLEALREWVRKPNILLKQLTQKGVIIVLNQIVKVLNLMTPNLTIHHID